VAEKPVVARRPEASRRGHQDGGVRRIFETRTHLVQNRLARVLFYIDTKGRMVLLHDFIKKTQKTPLDDLELARKNKSKHERGLMP
jgi:phage-related protein